MLGLDQGDIVLIDRKCEKMPWMQMGLCYCSKAFLPASWDQVGVVVEDDQGNLVVATGTSQGIVLRTLKEIHDDPLVKKIAIRKLFVNLSDFEKSLLSEEINKHMHKSFRDEFLEISPFQVWRVKDIFELEHKIDKLEREGQLSHISKFQKRIIDEELNNVRLFRH